MKWLWTAGALFLSVSAWAVLKADSVFTSNMVLQQEKPISFFGTAEPGKKIIVSFAGKNVTSEADKNAFWKADFPAMKGGSTNYTLTISDGKNTVTMKDILVGEVWFCSGQSNMQMPIAKIYRKGWSALNCEKEVSEAKYPEIRLAYQRHVFDLNKPLPASYSHAPGWVKCSPENVHYFSATAYFFGRKLHQDLKVPVGLILSALGGTAIQPWISYEGYKNAGLQQYESRIRRFRMEGKVLEEFVKNATAVYEKDMKIFTKSFREATVPEKEKCASWSSMDFDDASWTPFHDFPLKNFTVRWNRVRFFLPEIMKGKELLFMVQKCADGSDIYLNGEKIASWSPEDPVIKQQAEVRIPASKFRPDGSNLLAIRGEYLSVNQSSRYQRNMVNTTRFAFQEERFYVTKGWKQQNEFSCTSKVLGGLVLPRLYLPSENYQFPGNLYNGMVASWTRLPVRGILWYQGCANAGTMEYYALHKALIRDWRSKWGDPELPFIVTQLAGYDPSATKTWRTSDPNNPSGNALTRDIQGEMLKIKNVGLATAMDIGEPDNIHPGNKQEVGRRLALEAEKIAYGKKIVSEGPMFQSAVPEGKAIRVHFKNAESGLKTSDGKAPGAFAVAGADGNFVWAEAEIDGKTVLAHSEKVPAPKFVRYAYAGYRGDCNLQNQEGLPAYPFRSDAVDYSKEK